MGTWTEMSRRPLYLEYLGVLNTPPNWLQLHIVNIAIAVCWLDLANTYSSIHHDLIHFAMQNYNASLKLRNLVGNLYCGLEVLVTSPDWVTRPIRFKTGVHQGDPFSVVIFNPVMCVLWLTP